MGESKTQTDQRKRHAAVGLAQIWEKSNSNSNSNSNRSSDKHTTPGMLTAKTGPHDSYSGLHVLDLCERHVAR